mgnify:CR=1 FL=1
MSMTVDDSIKRWTAKRKAALVIEITQGKTTVSAASRSFDLTPSEFEGWVEDASEIGRACEPSVLVADAGADRTAGATCA